MDNNVFRKRDITINDKTYTIKQRSVADIFKFNTPPYIIIGSTGSGKSTLCTDLIFQYGKDCTNIYYVTATEDNINGESQNIIPKAFKRSPDTKTLISIWEEITNVNKSVNLTEERLKQLIGEIYGKQDGISITTRLDNQRKELQISQFNKYKVNKIDEKSANDLSCDDANAFYYDTCVRLILDGLKNKPELDLSKSDISIINSFISVPQKQLLILDDVTSQLTQMKISKNKILYNGQYMKESDAFHTLLRDILTRARHYNCIVALFLHEPDVIQDKSQITNLILLNDAAVQKMLLSRTITDNTKVLIKTLKDTVFSEYKHFFIYIDQLSMDVCVGKAELHFDDPLELDDLNKNFLEVYSTLAAGFTANNLNDNESDSEPIEDDLESFV